jgi:hypothetical protein
MNERRWCEFATKGSDGNVTCWHLCFRNAGQYRSMCGRLFTTVPTIVSDKKPDQIRGICRRCERIAKVSHPQQRP